MAIALRHVPAAVFAVAAVTSGIAATAAAVGCSRPSSATGSTAGLDAADPSRRSGSEGAGGAAASAVDPRSAGEGHRAGPSGAEGADPGREPSATASRAVGPDGAATLTWEAPPPWEAVANPNPMRVASYRSAAAGHGEEALDLSVARAGGTAEANIQRWLGQFDDANRTERREERRVRGLDVQIVEIAGNYLGGAMMPGAPATPHSNWKLLAAIVATRSPVSYFFKLIGPSSAVDSVHPSFDRLIESIAPR